MTSIEHDGVTVIYDNERYVSVRMGEITHTAWGGLEIHAQPREYKVVNLCEHCHRFDSVEVTVRSIEEAIERGWLILAP